MKKWIVTLIILLPIISFSASQEYTLKGVNYQILINGQPLDSIAMNYEGTTMLPLRAVSEALDIPIEWTGNVEINTLNVEELFKACVMITSDYGQGSGVLIGYDEILTCNHVVEKGEEFKAEYQDGSKIKCDLEFKTYYPDIAILKPKETDTKPVKIGDSDEIKVGDRVLSISSPKGTLNVVEWGEILTAPRDYQGNLYGVTTNLKIKPGSSGGAVFNQKGELIGLTNSVMPDQVTNIIPINDIRKGLTQ